MPENRLLPAFIDVYFAAIRNIDAVITKPLTIYRLSFAQYQILYDIARSPEVTLTGIMEARGVSKPAISRQLAVLRQLGYVSQKTVQADKRRHILLLPPLGKQTERAATEALGTELEHWATALGHASFTNLLDLLRQVGELRQQAKVEADE